MFVRISFEIQHKISRLPNYGDLKVAHEDHVYKRISKNLDANAANGANTLTGTM